MIIKVNKSEQIKAKLIQQGKAITFLNQPKHLKAISELDCEMEEVRREYTLKEKESQDSAKKIVFASEQKCLIYTLKSAYVS